jgi:hypothetical protein
MNIACFVPGCTNPVIGQCQGYQKSCGSYYCATHSQNKLCDDCVKQILGEKEAERTYIEYLKMAEAIDHKVRYSRLPILILGFILFMLAIISNIFKGSAIYIIIILQVVVIIGAYIKSNNYQKEILAGIDKPAFSDFYFAWKSETNKAQLKKGLSVAGTLAVIVLGVAVAAQKQQAYDNLRQIKNKLD